VPASLLLAHARVNLDEWEACAPIADLLLERQPDAPWGSLLKGAVLAIRGDRDAAEPHLARARELGAELPAACLALGLLALRLRDIDGAAGHFRAALLHQSDLIPALRGLAIASRARGDLETADALLRQAVTLRFVFPEAHLELGIVLADQGRVAEAMHALRTALQQNPGLTAAEIALQRLVQAQLVRRSDN
jgi:tetratricopeptide (TPR) repeat protein